MGSVAKDMSSVAKRVTDFIRHPKVDFIRRPKVKKRRSSPRPDDRIRRAMKIIDAPDNKSADLREMERMFRESFEALPDRTRRELATEIAKTQARDMAADVVRRALQEPDAPSLRKIQEAVGIDPSQISKISVGALDEGPHLWTLFRIALALSKRVVVSFE